MQYYIICVSAQEKTTTTFCYEYYTVLYNLCFQATGCSAFCNQIMDTGSLICVRILFLVHVCWSIDSEGRKHDPSPWCIQESSPCHWVMIYRSAKLGFLWCGGFFLISEDLGRMFDNSFSPTLFCLFVLKWRLACACYFHSLSQDQSTVAQQAEMSVTKCSPEV